MLNPAICNHSSESLSPIAGMIPKGFIMLWAILFGMLSLIYTTLIMLVSGLTYHLRIFSAWGNLRARFSLCLLLEFWSSVLNDFFSFFVDAFLLWFFASVKVNATEILNFVWFEGKEEGEMWSQETTLFFPGSNRSFLPVISNLPKICWNLWQIQDVLWFHNEIYS